MPKKKKRNRAADKTRIPIPVLEGPGKRYYQEKMKWLLDLINLNDFKELTDTECIKKLNECIEFTMGRPDMYKDWHSALMGVFQKGTDGKWDIETIRGFLASDRNYFRKCFNDIIRYCEEEDPLYEFEYLYHEVPPQRVWISQFEESKRFKGGKKLMAIPDYRSVDTLNLLPLLLWPMRKALIEFLSHFDIERIRKCQHADCRKYFFKKYKSDDKPIGDFCSERCRNRAKQAKYRETHREDYNKYFRDRRRSQREPKFEARCRQCDFIKILSEKDIQELTQSPFKCPDCGDNCLYRIKEYLGRQGGWHVSVDYGYLEFIDELRAREIVPNA